MAFSSHGAFELPAMLLQADQALYRAKNEGRNRLAIAKPDAAPRTRKNDEAETRERDAAGSTATPRRDAPDALAALLEAEKPRRIVDQHAVARGLSGT